MRRGPSVTHQVTGLLAIAPGLVLILALTVYPVTYSLWLSLLDKHMARNRFAAGDRYSVADVALYSYTHLAEQCDFDLRPFPALRDWHARVAAEPLHVAMDHRPEAITLAAE